MSHFVPRTCFTESLPTLRVEVDCLQSEELIGERSEGFKAGLEEEERMVRAKKLNEIAD